LKGVLAPNDVPALFERIEAAKASPNVRVEELGRVGDLPVTALHFRSAEQPPKVRVLITAGVHGNEPCGTGAAALLVEQLLKDPRISRDVEVTVVPLMNPGGMEHGTRRNEDDLDLNRHATEGADAPEEIQALGRMLEREQPYDLAVDLHGGKSKRDGFFALHRGARELLEPAFQRFAQRWPVLHRDTKPYEMKVPGIGESNNGNTVKDFVAAHGVRAALTLEAPGSVSYLDQVLGENELVHEIINQARRVSSASNTQ
jgi:predicted deacylase